MLMHQNVMNHSQQHNQLSLMKSQLVLLKQSSVLHSVQFVNNMNQIVWNVMKTEVVPLLVYVMMDSSNQKMLVLHVLIIVSLVNLSHIVTNVLETESMPQLVIVQMDIMMTVSVKIVKFVLKNV